MNQIIIKLNDFSDDEQRITSKEIAELTGKAHNHVMRDIRNMEPAWEKVHQSKFGQMQIREKLPNNGYRYITVYALTKLECLYIATKYNDEARAKLVLRWAEKEGITAQAMEHEVLRLETENEILKRSDEILRVEISEENAPAMDCFTNTEMAKMLHVDRKWLTSMLRREEVLIWTGDRYELQPPYDLMGLEMYRHHQGYSLRGERKKSVYMVWTPKGKKFLKDLVARVKKEEKEPKRLAYVY